MTAVKLPFEAYKHLLSGKPFIRPPRRTPPADGPGPDTEPPAGV